MLKVLLRSSVLLVYAIVAVYLNGSYSYSITCDELTVEHLVNFIVDNKKSNCDYKYSGNNLILCGSNRKCDFNSVGLCKSNSNSTNNSHSDSDNIGNECQLWCNSVKIVRQGLEDCFRRNPATVLAVVTDCETITAELRAAYLELIIPVFYDVVVIPSRSSRDYFHENDIPVTCGESTYSYSRSQGHSYNNDNSYKYSYGDINSDINSYSNGDSDSNCDRNSCNYSYGDTNSDSNSNSNSSCSSNSNSNSRDLLVLFEQLQCSDPTITERIQNSTDVHIYKQWSTTIDRLLLYIINHNYDTIHCNSNSEEKNVQQLLNYDANTLPTIRLVPKLCGYEHYLEQYLGTMNKTTDTVIDDSSHNYYCFQTIEQNNFFLEQINNLLINYFSVLASLKLYWNSVTITAELLRLAPSHELLLNIGLLLMRFVGKQCNNYNSNSTIATDNTNSYVINYNDYGYFIASTAICYQQQRNYHQYCKSSSNSRIASCINCCSNVENGTPSSTTETVEESPNTVFPSNTTISNCYRTKSNNTKKRVAIYCNEYGQAWWPGWGPSSVITTGMGGSEEAVYYISLELARHGYDVDIYAAPLVQDIGKVLIPDTNNNTIIIGRVLWLHQDSYDIYNHYDVFISWRYSLSLSLSICATKTYLWLHDLVNKDVLMNYFFNQFNGIIVQSKFHSDYIDKQFQQLIYTPSFIPSIKSNGTTRLVNGNNIKNICELSSNNSDRRKSKIFVVPNGITEVQNDIDSYANCKPILTSIDSNSNSDSNSNNHSNNNDNNDSHSNSNGNTSVNCTSNNNSVFIYASSPSRGLQYVLTEWKIIKAAIPLATLKVFYGYTKKVNETLQLEMGNSNFETYYKQIQLLLQQDGITYYGSVSHTELRKHFLTGGFLLYPTTFPETGCITVIRAMYYGVIPITSRFANSNLYELTKKYDLNSDSPLNTSIANYPKLFLQWVHNVWTKKVIESNTIYNLSYLSTLRLEMMNEIRQEYSWSNSALKLINIMDSDG